MVANCVAVDSAISSDCSGICQYSLDVSGRSSCQCLSLDTSQEVPIYIFQLARALQRVVQHNDVDTHTANATHQYQGICSTHCKAFQVQPGVFHHGLVILETHFSESYRAGSDISDFELKRSVDYAAPQLSAGLHKPKTSRGYVVTQQAQQPVRPSASLQRTFARWTKVSCGVCKATDMELTPRLRASRSSRATSAAIYVPGQKSPVTRPRSKSRRRAGRPITYKDNPDAKNLTEGERRKVKRRIANRESARRVRARRAETLEELQIKMGHLSDANAKYIDRVTEAEESKDEAEGQIRLFQHKLQEITADNQALHRQVDMLEKRLSGTDSMELVSPSTNPSVQYQPFSAAELGRLPLTPT
ncbi:hypothetical protein WJX82_003577 [Trebouxia sp. C0006]